VENFPVVQQAILAGIGLYEKSARMRAFMQHLEVGRRTSQGG